jgi:hypothetical protein
MTKKTTNKEYIIVNKEGEAYIGMLYGKLMWSYNWDEAKPLLLENTTLVIEHNPYSEAIEL